MALPTNRTTESTEAEHVADHNTVHGLHNELESIAGLSEVTVASGDIVLIEDISDSNNKRRTTAQDIADLGVGGSDGDAIHDNVADEISALTQVTPATGDHVLIEDLSDSNNKKRVTAGDIAALATTANDEDAIHDNVAGEINALTQVTAAASDVVLIEDASDSNNKKKVTAQSIADLGGGGGGGGGPTVVNVNSNTTLVAGDTNKIYIVDSDGASRTITLPLLSSIGAGGFEVTIKRIGSNSVLVETQSSDEFEISGIDTKTLWQDFSAIKVCAGPTSTVFAELGFLGGVTQT